MKRRSFLKALGLFAILPAAVTYQRTWKAVNGVVRPVSLGRDLFQVECRDKAIIVAVKVTSDLEGEYHWLALDPDRPIAESIKQGRFRHIRYDLTAKT